MMRGKIIRALSGFYYVKCDESRKVYECKGRGILRKENIVPVVGDDVIISITDEKLQKGMLEEILDRKNLLIRPPISNVTKAILVFAVKTPDPNLSLIDRFIVLAEKEGLEIVICFNKIDLQDESSYLDKLSVYKRAGYKVIPVSAEKDLGIKELKKELNGHVTVVAGPSGAGKSSLINRIDSSLELKTSDISQKSGRGKHTTRYAQLIEIGENSLIADTPGFSSLTLDMLEDNELKEYFIEFHEFDHDCKFGFKCIHENEPGCMVKKAVEENNLPLERYESYLQLLGEIRDSKKRRY